MLQLSLEIFKVHITQQILAGAYVKVNLIQCSSFILERKIALETFNDINAETNANYNQRIPHYNYNN